MGADGGVSWIRVSGDKELFRRLVRPLNLLIQHGSSNDSAHHDFLDANPLPSDCIYTFYGTDLRRCGWEELRDIIGYWQDQREDRYRDYYWEKTDPLQLTWEEILVDYLTHPHFAPEYDYYGVRHPWGLPEPIQHMYEEYSIWFDPEKLQIKRGISCLDYAFLEMKIADWLAQIEPLVDLKSINSERTWT